MSPRNDIRLCVIIPVFDNWNDTMECLAALAEQSTPAFHVIVADDGSSSPPPARLHEFGFVRYMRNDHRGFGGNCNTAAQEAIRLGATHLLFLNDDTVVPRRFLETWLGVLASRPEAILSPVIYRFDQPSSVWYSGGNLSIWVPFLKLRQAPAEPTEVDMVSGCSLVVPATVWRALGGFDEIYETYFEDLDFCMRARKSGTHVYLIPGSDLKVLHKVSGSFRNTGAWRQQYLMMTTRLLFIRRHYSGLSRWLCLGLSAAHLAAILVLCLPEAPRPRRLWKSLSQGFAALPESAR